MKNKTLGIALLVGAGLWLVMRQKQVIRIPAWYNPSTIPPQPTPNTPQWQAWAQGIINIYGAVAWLWQPGGPFYKVPTATVYDAIPDPGQYNWNDPYSYPEGWA